MSEEGKEQAKVDVIYARLDELRSENRERLQRILRAGAVGTHQNRSEREAKAEHYELLLQTLSAVEDRLVFGKLTMSNGNERYIGRLGIAGADRKTLLTDWRAPIAEDFYRATPTEPRGIAFRRHILTKFRKVASIDDEIIDAESPYVQEILTSGGIKGEGALFRKLKDPTTGKMNDIVATIQAEQDLIIRSSMDGALIIQGGPGTGKTAVVLHRAAYLLYANREKLRGGVMLVGPNRSFLQYIDQVIPSLGETGVTTTTMHSILPHINVGRIETHEEQQIKGMPEMVEVIKNAANARKSVPAGNQEIPLSSGTLLLRRRDVMSCMRAVEKYNVPHNIGRNMFAKMLLKRLVDQYIDERLKSGAIRGGISSGDEWSKETVMSDISSNRDVRIAINLAWMPMRPERLVGELWSKPHRLKEVAPFLTDKQREALFQPMMTVWGLSDIPLLDEAAEVLGDYSKNSPLLAQQRNEQRKAQSEYAAGILAMTGSNIVDASTLSSRYEDADYVGAEIKKEILPTYGHIIIDEAQELSFMQWRMLRRRCPSLSMTIAGDVAQRTSLAGSRDWNAIIPKVFGDEYHTEELTVNYRNPSEVAELAIKFAKKNKLYVNQRTSLRSEEKAVQIIKSENPIDTAAEHVIDLAKHFINSDGTGRVCCITSEKSLAALSTAIDNKIAQEFGEDEVKRLNAQENWEMQITVNTALNVKGLEFDAVLLYEPSELYDEQEDEQVAISDVYVSITRPTKKLVIVHAKRLPKGLG
ncbi:MAG: AAA family ATPase [Bifidobacteriaceae bacterium]|nr:AAA family ATPase [Bifidobacteriaceae bacterium]